MSTRAEEEDLGALLRPWREMLLELRLLAVETRRGTDEEPQVWLEWQFPRGDRVANLPRILEAVQLYALLERADRRAWLSNEWSAVAPWRPNSWRQDAVDSRSVARVCGWKVKVDHVEDGNLLCSLLSGDQSAADTSSFSSEFFPVRRALEAKIPLGMAVTTSMFFQFSLGLAEWKRVWELLPAVGSLAARQAIGLPPSCPLSELGARLECVDFSPSLAAQVDAPALEQLNQLCRYGIVVPTLPEFELTTTSHNAVALVKTLRATLGSRCGGFHDGTRQATLTTSMLASGTIASATTDATGLDYVHASFPGETANDQTAALH